MKANKDVIHRAENSCLDTYDYIKNEISSGIEEGVEEGIKEGFKGGILDGLAECFDIGFLNLRKTKAKELEEMLECAAADTIEKEVKSNVKIEICPVLSDQLRNSCNNILEEIKKHKTIVSTQDVDLILSNIAKVADNKNEEIEKNIKKHRPTNFVLTAFFDGMQEAISECLIENIKKCEEKIQEYRGLSGEE